ncbi:hypothetical protein ACJMK2_020214, partial [Sinanodonta woodiana]
QNTATIFANPQKRSTDNPYNICVNRLCSVDGTKTETWTIHNIRNIVKTEETAN